MNDSSCAATSPRLVKFSVELARLLFGVLSTSVSAVLLALFLTRRTQPPYSTFFFKLYVAGTILNTPLFLLDVLPMTLLHSSWGCAWLLPLMTSGGPSHWLMPVHMSTCWRTQLQFTISFICALNRFSVVFSPTRMPQFWRKNGWKFYVLIAILPPIVYWYTLPARVYVIFAIGIYWLYAEKAFSFQPMEGGPKFTPAQSDFIVESAYDSRESLFSGNAKRGKDDNQKRNAIWKKIEDRFLVKFRVHRPAEKLKDHLKYRKKTFKEKTAKWNKYLTATGGGLDEEAEKLRAELTDELGYTDYLLCLMFASTPTFTGVGKKELETGWLPNNEGAAASDSTQPAPRESAGSVPAIIKVEQQEHPPSAFARTHAHGEGSNKKHARRLPMKRTRSRDLESPQSGLTSSVDEDSEEEEAAPRKRSKRSGRVSEQHVRQAMIDMFKAQENAALAQQDAATKTAMLVSKIHEKLSSDDICIHHNQLQPSSLEDVFTAPMFQTLHHASSVNNNNTINNRANSAPSAASVFSFEY